MVYILADIVSLMQSQPSSSWALPQKSRSLCFWPIKPNFNPTLLLPCLQKNLFRVTRMHTPTSMVLMGHPTNRPNNDFIWEQHLCHSKTNHARTTYHLPIPARDYFLVN